MTTTNRAETWGAYDVTIYTEGGPTHCKMNHNELNHLIDSDPEISLVARCESQLNVPVVSVNCTKIEEE